MWNTGHYKEELQGVPSLDLENQLMVRETWEGLSEEVTFKPREIEVALMNKNVGMGDIFQAEN